MSRFLGLGNPTAGGSGGGAQGSSSAQSHARMRDKFLRFLKPQSQRTTSNSPSSVLQQNPTPQSAVSQFQQLPSPNPPSTVLQLAPPPNPVISVSQQAPSPSQSGLVLQQTAAHCPSGSIDLWTQAYHRLPDALQQQQLGVSGGPDKLQVLKNVFQAAVQAQEANMAKRLKLKWGDKEINIQETADRLFGWITKFKAVGDIAVQYDPVHAALPGLGLGLFCW